jgi:hypothetical protein
MNRPLAELLQTRAQLRAKIAMQRVQLAQTTQHWQKPLAVADQGLQGLRWLRGHPLTTIGMVAYFGLRGGGVARLVIGVWRGWQLYRHTRTLLTKVRRRSG